MHHQARQQRFWNYIKHSRSAAFDQSTPPFEETADKIPAHHPEGEQSADMKPQTEPGSDERAGENGHNQPAPGFGGTEQRASVFPFSPLIHGAIEALFEPISGKNGRTVGANDQNQCSPDAGPTKERFIHRAKRLKPKRDRCEFHAEIRLHESIFRVQSDRSATHPARRHSAGNEFRANPRRIESRSTDLRRAFLFSPCR